MAGQPKAVFFDIGDTLASPVLSPNRRSLAGLRVYPFVPEILQALGHQTVPLGLISNTAPDDTMQTMQAILKQVGLLRFFDVTLLLFSSVEGLDKTRGEFFQRAATRAGIPPQRCVFVGEDAQERAVARTAFFQVSFHPLHVFHVLQEMV